MNLPELPSKYQLPFKILNEHRDIKQMIYSNTEKFFYMGFLDFK